MKKLITILLLAISGFASAQTYQLNYPDIRIGNSNTGKIVLRGSNIQFPFLALGNTTDSVLTIVGGVVKKVPRSQFSGGSSYTFNNGLTNAAGVVGLGGDASWFAPNGIAIKGGDDFGSTELVISSSYSSITHNVYTGDGTVNTPRLNLDYSGASLYLIREDKELGIFIGGFGDGGNPSSKFSDALYEKGLFYSADYSIGRTFPTDNLWIPNAGWVNSQIAASGGGGGAVSSVFGRTGAVTAQSSDYDPFYPLLVGTYNNPAWINTLAYSKITGVPAFYSASNPPPSQVQNSLVSSSTLAPSVDAVNAALATKGSGTVTSFSKTDGVGIVSSVTNATTTPNHTIAVDTTTIRTVANSLTLAQLQTKLNAYLTTSSATATYVPLTRTVSTGNGLSGGGALSSNLTLTADTSILATKANTRNLAQLQTTFNTKQNNITLTTTGTSGAATLVGSTLNIPNYTTGAGAYVDLTTNQTVDGLKLFKQDVLIDGSTGSGIKQFGFKDADLNTSFDGGFSFDGGYSYLRSGTNKQMVMASYWGSEIVGNTQGATPYAIAAATGVVTDHSLRVRQITTTAPIFEVKAASGNSSRILNLSSSSGTGDYMFVSSAGALNLPLLTASTLLKLDASKNVVNAVSGTDFVIPSGNVATATALATSRNLWGVAFNGTANVTGKPVFTAGATGAASINIPHGVAPTTPVNGDIWSTTAGFFARINGVTQSFLPLAGGALTGGLFGTTSEFSTYARVGASASTHIDMTSGDIKYYASNGTTLLSVYPLTLTSNRVQRYQDKDGTIALTSDIPTTPTLQQVTTAGATANNNIAIDIANGNLKYELKRGSNMVASLASGSGSTGLNGILQLYDTPAVEAVRVYASGATWFNGGNSLFGTTTDNGVDKVQVNGSISATNLGAGTYTPTGTITDGSGTVTSITPLTTHYSRIGNQVTVSGAVTFSTAASNTNVTIELTLPISSNFGNGYDAFGSGDVASSLTNYSAHVVVTGNPTTDKAIITLNTLSGTFTAYYRYMYTII